METINEVLPDSRLNATQRKVKYLNPSKDCYLATADGDYPENYEIHLQDPELDRAMVKMQDDQRPRLGADPAADHDFESEHEAYFPHFLVGLPEAFRRLGFGRKCYYMLMEELDCVLLSGSNNIHVSSPEAIRTHRSMDSYELTDSLYREIEGNSYAVTFRKKDSSIAEEVMQEYLATSQERKSDEVDPNDFGAWLDSDKPSCMYSYYSLLPYLCISLQYEGDGTWAKNAAFLTDIDHEYQYSDYGEIKNLATLEQQMSEKYKNSVILDAYRKITEDPTIKKAVRALDKPITIQGFYDTFKKVKEHGFRIHTAERYMKKQGGKYASIGILVRPANLDLYMVAERCPRIT